MPVAYTTDTPLTVPAEAFNTDGIATLILTGASYGGGYWTINACHGPGDDPTILGTVETDQTTDPEELPLPPCPGSATSAPTSA